MATVRPTPAAHNPVTLGAGLLRDEPGTIWSQRRQLSQESLDQINSTAFMCIEDGQLKLDVEAIERFKKNTPARDFIDKFQSSLEKKNVPTTRYSQHKSTEPEPATKVGSLVVKRSDFDGKASTRACKLGKRPRVDDKCEEQKAPKTPDNKLHEPTSNPPSPGGTYIKRIDVLQVPHGVCGGDRLAIFDHVKAPSIFIDVPSDAYDGMRLQYERPSTPVKLLLVDGKGYKVGGNPMRQHATRLNLHRDTCTNSRCPVLGCKGDPAFALFQKVDSDAVNNYRQHWATACRTAMRSHGLQLRMLASGV